MMKVFPGSWVKLCENVAILATSPEAIPLDLKKGEHLIALNIRN